MAFSSSCSVPRDEIWTETSTFERWIARQAGAMVMHLVLTTIADVHRPAVTDQVLLGTQPFHGMAGPSSARLYAKM